MSILDSAIQELKHTLSLEERLRMKRFRFYKDRKRFVVGRGILRALLGRYLRCRPSEIALSYNAYGKPGLSVAGEPRIAFNYSHSGELMLFAFTSSCDVGIDIERMRRSTDEPTLLSRTFLSTHEIARLREAAPAFRARISLSTWVRKEALAKAIGMGLSLPFDRISLPLDLDSGGKFTIRFDGTEWPREWWSIRDLRPAQGYIAALAYKGKDDLRLLCWRFEE